VSWFPSNARSQSGTAPLQAATTTTAQRLAIGTLRLAVIVVTRRFQMADTV